ncbi:MAG: glycosyltransferase family 4 protein [Candidatus Methylomirabilis sp.]
MKIALVRQRYRVGGGAERSLEVLMGELVSRGHEVCLFANRWDAPKIDGVTFHRVPVIGGLSFLRVLSFAAFSSFQVRRMDFDIVHSFDRTLCQHIYRAGDGCHREWLIQRHRAVPWRRAFDAMNPLHRSILFLERRIFAPGRGRVIANCKKVKEQIVRHYGMPDSFISVIYNGVDLDRFHPQDRDRLRLPVREALGFSRDDMILLLVGSGFERKGVRYLIQGAAEALARMARKVPLRLLVAGKGNPQAYLALAERLGMEGRLSFIGVWPRIEELYAVSDVFVLPTIYDPFANACLEAMACGLPVITTASNGVSELIVDGYNGFILSDPTDHQGLAARILDLADQDRRSSMGLEARKVAEHFPMGRHVQGILTLYRQVVAERRDTPCSPGAR